MIGISIAAKKEWEFTCDYFGKTIEDRKRTPFGGYFMIKIKNEDAIVYFAGNGKVRSAASCQYMIDKFGLTKVIIAGTCAGIDDKYKILDIIIPNRAVQCDCTVKELKPLIRNDFIVDIDIAKYGEAYNTGTIGTSDKPIVLPKDYCELRNNEITVADMESAAIAYICKKNDVESVIIKGISDIPAKYEADDEAFLESKGTYAANVPFVMKKIFDDYLIKFI